MVRDMTDATRPGASRRVWVVRAGRKGESFDAGIERGFCGVGWPDMGDLSILGDEALEREIDVIYGHEPDGRVQTHKTQLRDFMHIRRGDLVLTPHPGRRQIAVGTVTGDYE